MQDGDDRRHRRHAPCRARRWRLIWALIRAGRKQLSCARCIVSSDGDLAVRLRRLATHIVTSWFSQGILWGVSKVMRHHVETRQGALRRMEPHGDGHALSRRRHGRAVHADPLDARFGRAANSGPRRKEIDCPFTGEKLLLVPALNPGRRAHPRAALRRLRQRADRRPAVHGHRSRDGRQQRDPDDRAHRLQRSDPPRAGPDQDSLLLRSTPWSRCRSAARRTNATASTSR